MNDILEKRIIENTQNKKNLEIRELNKNTIEVKGIFKTNSLSNQIYDFKKKIFFKEKINKGAFSSVLKKMKSNNLIPNLILNHDWNTKNYFKILDFYFTEEKDYFTFTFLILKNNYAKRLFLENEKQAFSFAFIAEKENWENQNGQVIRNIISFKILSEFSLLTKDKLPAYNDTIIEIKDRNNFKICVGDLKEDLSLIEQEQTTEDIKKFLDDTLKSDILKLKKKANDREFLKKAKDYIKQSKNLDTTLDIKRDFKKLKSKINN